MKWLQRWRSFDPDPEIMRRSSPKYVPREWMLVEDRTFIDVKRMMQMQYASNEHGSANAKLRLQMLASDNYVQ